ncbi:putative leucine-rich repeat-containing protein DDB_G0281931 [Dendronephthya gigantea]|uniref:putative leucine-rich repeat-containing protein DDB_G0281931 n=1 Tax=Dendronephthya gigantea TaxID=151771 RepID=UPI0010695396|nr:putative leucine-rich repeat-containing protein DDB_G0281931 [Dendronephthya gigantea]
MIGRLHLMIKCGLVVLCLGKYSIVFDKQTFSHVNDSTEQSWDTLNYPHEVRLCMHDLPVVPKEPLILNSTFNATVERGILLEIYRLTNGLNWTNSSGWGGSGSHCQWYGVGCSNITNGRVTVLTLEANRLQGTLPSTLWMLRDLQGLCLDANPGLYGKMGDFLSSNMTRLMRLDLASCNLDGVIPDEIIAGSKSLVKLQLSGNKLSGVIPPSIGQLTELQVLSLGENTPITGKVPEGVGNLSKLWFLDLESLGDLDTTIKPFLGLSSLKFLHMSESGIHGTLPDDFGSSFPLLWECLLSRNYLHGTIPKTMGKLTALAHLNLAGNKFSGQVPKGLGELNNLEVIDLSNNSLSGFEEGFSFNSSKLALLTVAQNRDFSTQLSRVFKILQSAINSLRRLDFGGCHLTGDIPHVMWSFMNLIEFNVKDNLLSGFLPLPGQNMLFLITLDFSGNKLMGDIPEYYADLLGLQTFDVSRNPSLRYAGGDSPKIPRFAKTDKSTMIRENKNDHYTCPVIRFRYNSGIIKMDSTYYDKRSFSALAPCLEDIDRRYMGQNPWVDCPSHEYRVMRILGYCSLGAYILGVPFILFLPLLICAFWNKGNGVNREGAGGERNERDFWMGFLYLAYKEEFRSYIEIFFLLRRAVFAAILSFISYHSPFQVPVLTVGFLICLHFIVVCKPYECSSYLKVGRFKVNVENGLECLILVVLLLSFVFLGQESARKSQNVALLWLVIAGNSLATVVCIAAAVMRLVRKVEQPTPPASAQASETQSLLPENGQTSGNYGSTDSAASAVEDGQ